MATFIGKLFKAGLNVVKPTSKGWAKPGQTGWKAFINGTQSIQGNYHIFQGGLKHKFLMAGYPKAMKNLHNVLISPYSTGKQGVEAYNRIPKCLHQAANELSEVMSWRG